MHVRLDTYFKGADPAQPEGTNHAGALHALRKRSLRTCLSCSCHGTQRRRLERHGLQPLRRHEVLLEQLPVQSPAIQLLPL